ncbi:hypothetical protein PUR33_00525, partial [Streptomyces sp. BE282]|nr:hypothetical protein [Streptomyces sp. BE282]
MATNLTLQVRNIAEVTTAVAKGDLTKKYRKFVVEGMRDNTGDELCVRRIMLNVGGGAWVAQSVKHLPKEKNNNPPTKKTPQKQQPKKKNKNKQTHQQKKPHK